MCIPIQPTLVQSQSEAVDTNVIRGSDPIQESSANVQAHEVTAAKSRVEFYETRMPDA